MARLEQAPIAELDHLGEVVTGVDVQHPERQRQRAEGLLGDAQQRDRILAPTEQQHRPGQLGHDLAHHEHRLGLQCPKLRDARGGGAHADPPRTRG